MVDEMGLGKMFPLMAVAMIWNLTQKVDLGLALSLLWEHTLQERVHMAQNNCPGITNEQQKLNPLQRPNSLPQPHLGIQRTEPQGNPGLTSVLELMIVVAMPAVTERFISVINKMTYGTNLKLMNILPAECVNFSHRGLNTGIKQSRNRWNIHLAFYVTLTSRAKLSSHSQLTNCEWSFEILMSLIGRGQKTVWVGKLYQNRKFNSNVQSTLHRQSIHSMSGVSRPGGCFKCT